MSDEANPKRWLGACAEQTSTPTTRPLIQGSTEPSGSPVGRASNTNGASLLSTPRHNCCPLTVVLTCPQAPSCWKVWLGRGGLTQALTESSRENSPTVQHTSGRRVSWT